jgi:hypothetical protein
MLPNLKNPKLKVERAKEHLDFLNIKAREFIRLNPFRVTTEEDVQKGHYILQFHVPIIDLKLGIIADDVVYNLRSALDHITWQLALTTTDTPHERTAFPIIDRDTTKKMSRFDDITRDVPVNAINEIKELQPYHRGAAYKDELLWKLDKLCNIGKHRIIPAHGTAIDFKIPKGIEIIYMGSLDNKHKVILPITAKAQMQFNPPPTGEILFGSEIDGLVVGIGEFNKIYEFVRDKVFPRFSRFFSQGVHRDK